MMRGAAARAVSGLSYDLPPCFVIPERRLAGLAIDCWRVLEGNAVSGFEANSLLVAVTCGQAMIESIGEAVAATFAMAPGMSLDRRDGLAAEITIACDLIAIDPQPVSFEASVTTPEAALLLLRGVALPVWRPGTAPTTGPFSNLVQIVVSWRELLNPAATARLRRDLGASLRLVGAERLEIDPFRENSSGRGSD